MPPRSWKERSVPRIANFFNQSPPAAYKELELRKLFNRHRKSWQLPDSLTNKKLLNFLVDSTLLTAIEIESQKYESQETVRYCWGDVSPFAVANSLRPSSFLAYSSAAYVNGLIDEIPKTFYVNKEQSEKPPNTGGLQQASIDRAFSGKQRKSEMVLSWSGYQAVIINGKNSGNLGVVTQELDDGSKVHVTNLERTLVDMAVRPGYSGGVHKVLEAYERARNNLKTVRLATYLKKLDYTYPYHQCIGFYLEKAGYPENALARFLDQEIAFDFYLDYGIKSPDFVKRWRLYVPKGFGF